MSRRDLLHEVLDAPTQLWLDNDMSSTATFPRTANLAGARWTTNGRTFTFETQRPGYGIEVAPSVFVESTSKALAGQPAAWSSKAIASMILADVVNNGAGFATWATVEVAA